MSSNSSVKIVWIILLWLIALIVVLNLNQDGSNDNHSGHGGHKNVFESGALLPVELSEILSVELVYQGDSYLLEKDKSGHWFYHVHGATNGVLDSHEHTATPDENETISISLMGLENARVERRLKTREKDEYGVTKPSLISILYGWDKSRPISQFAFGDLATDHLSRYIHLVGSDQVATIANYQYTSLIELVEKLQKINREASQKTSRS
ncbi:MAG: hypothetical protein O3B03_01775 [Proteobacteria bacterium]|nr:hypothetical protein [Pseudomonadota bacterium]MDA1331220.1 hypothetical protein [Pseudomonadota bacterium]